MYDKRMVTPSNDEDHDERGSSSTSQDLHEACFQDCWQVSEVNMASD